MNNYKDLELYILAEEAKILPYIPGNRSLEAKTLGKLNLLTVLNIYEALNAIYYPGRAELNVHSLYGLMETYETHRVLKEKFGHYQPFVLSRSTFPGSGKYSAHWTGDNLANWEFLRLSISGVFNFNVYQLLS